MNRISQATTVPVYEALDLLSPSHELWNHPGFKRWRDELQQDLVVLSDVGIVLGTPSAKSRSAINKILELCGLEWPKSQEEELRVYLGLRTVLCFVTRKLDQLQAESSKYEQLKKEQVQANGDIGISRNVAR